MTNPPRDQSFVARQQFHSKVFQFIDPRQRVKSQLPQCFDALQGIVRIVLLPDEHTQHVHTQVGQFILHHRVQAVFVAPTGEIVEDGHRVVHQFALACFGARVDAAARMLII